MFAVSILGNAIGGSNSSSTSTSTQSNQASKNEQAAEQWPADSTIETKRLSYEVVKKESNSAVENYKVLISVGEDGKAVATEVRKSCGKPCNISVFDDRKALDLQIEYDTMMGDVSTPVSAPQDWKNKNYVFVADHLVGAIDFDSDEWSKYPYKDWYYKQLKGE
jgi:hypothetical protein